MEPARGWVISARPAHRALVSEDDFIAAQDISASYGPAPQAAPAAPQKRRYLLACGTCGRRMESAWSNGKPAYRCRHGHTSATPPDLHRPKNAYVREDRILSQLPALHLLRVVPMGFEIGHGSEVWGRSACPDRLVAGTMGA